MSDDPARTKLWLARQAMPPLSEQLPVRFANGTEWRAAAGRCAGCEQPLMADRLTGRMVALTPQTYAMEAAGECPACGMRTLFDYRIHDDLRITGLRDGRWCTWQPRAAARHRRWRRLAWAGLLLGALGVLTGLHGTPQASPLLVGLCMALVALNAWLLLSRLNGPCL